MGQAKIKRNKLALKIWTEPIPCTLGLKIEPLTVAEKVAAEAIAAIKQRSFSGRNPELGKMINCICGRRHRESEKCNKVTYIAVAGETPETESLVEANRHRLKYGAAPYKGKRKHPHHKRKQNAKKNARPETVDSTQAVQLVETELPVA
jgi:hypothetical protein